MKKIVVTKEDSQSVHFVKLEDDGHGGLSPLRRVAADLSIEQSRGLLTAGGFLDSQTGDTQFFGFTPYEGSPVIKKGSPAISEGSPVRSEGSSAYAESSPVCSEESPVRKKIRITKDFEDSDLGTPSPIQSMKREEDQLVGIRRRYKLELSPVKAHTPQNDILSLSTAAKEEADKNQGTFIFDPSDVAGLDEEDDEYLEAKIDGLVQELGRARAHVNTLENELVSFVSVRYARMKTIIATSRAAGGKEEMYDPSEQESQTWDDHGHLAEDPYYPSIETQIYRTINAGYRAPARIPKKWLS